MILPKSFENRIKEKLGDESEAFIEALQEKAPVSIRINPRKGNDLFEDAEQIPWCKFGKYLAKRPAFVWDPLYHSGAYYAQEASSMLFANAIDFSKDIKALDMCAAPGGKSSLMLSFMSTNSLLVSNEMVGKRASILYENLVKWGAPNVVITNNKSEDFGALEGYFDVVLVDAPCSGEGMFRKDPAVIGEWSEGMVEQCCFMQKEILETAVNLVAPDGLLIYSTCTFEERENENNLQWLYREFGHKLEPAELPVQPEWGITTVDVKVEGRNEPQKGYYCFPHKVKGEGLFISVFRIRENKQPRVKGAKGRVLRRLSAKEKEIVARYTNTEAEGIAYFAYNETVIAIPEKQEENISIIISKVRIKKAGTIVGIFVKNDFVPDHDLVMSNLFSDKIPQVELTLEQALDYQQKKPVNVSQDIPKGWLIFTYKGRGIGWAKNLGNRINNHYPSEWRIRKEPVFE